MKTLIYPCVLLIVSFFAFTQKAVAQTNTFPSTGSAGIGTAIPNASSLLDMESTTKGLLIPRMTFTQRVAIASPATGLMVYQTNGSNPGFYYYNSTAWVILTSAAQWLANGSNLYYSAGNVGIGTSTPTYKLQVAGDINQSTGSVLRVAGNQILKADVANNNLAFGKSAGLAIITGQHNVAIGNKALSKYTASYNTAVGDSALIKNTNDGGGGSANNTAVGYQALAGDVVGIDNAAFGNGTLLYSTTSFNTALGSYALTNQTSGGANTAIGNSAMQNNSTGTANTAIGRYALGAGINTGSYNNATGYYALSNNTSGTYNDAHGADALYSNTTGNANVAYGTQAGFNNISGGGNTYIGVSAGQNNTTGSDNVCIGYGAATSDGINNSVVIGTNLNTSLSNVVILGSSGQTVGIGTTSPYASTQMTLIGNGAQYYSFYAENDYSNSEGGEAIQAIANTGGGYGLDGESRGSTSDEINIGVYGYATGSTDEVDFSSGGTEYSSLGDYGVYGETNVSDGWGGGFNGNVLVFGNIFSTSDEKFKKNIQPLNTILDEINKVPVKQFDFNQDVAKQSKLALPSVHQVGFIAQDIQKIFPNLVAPVIAPVRDDSAKTGKPKKLGATSLLSLNYIGFIPLLTKAVQELSAANSSKDSAIASLQSQINQLNILVQTLAAKSGVALSSNNASLSTALLQQNVPNPYSNSTSIAYTLPQNYSSAQIIITDNSGKTLKSINISGPGNGVLNVDASTLATGMYQYSLLIDGKLIDTKKMVLAK